MNVGSASVVIPTRNRRDLLALTLRSVLAQRDVDVEVVVVDEASTDGTPELVADLGDDRITLLRNERPLQVAGARNRGIAAARCDWVAFVDDDDLWSPDKLSRQLAAAADAGARWVYAGAVTIDADLGVVGGNPPPPPEEVRTGLRRFNAVPGGGSNVAVRRDELDAVGGFDVRLRNTEDWEMWLRLARRSCPAWVREPLVAYRVHGANASLDVEEVLAGTAVIEAEHGVRVDRGVLHRWFAETSLRSGRRAQAMRHLLSAARYGAVTEAAGDAAALVARRLGRAAPGPRAGADHEWLAQAESWLAPLRQRA